MNGNEKNPSPQSHKRVPMSSPPPSLSISLPSSSSQMVDADCGLPVTVNSDNPGMEIDETKAWKLHEINQLSQCRSFRLPDDDTISPTRISMLVYTSSGCEILALASNAVHMMWMFTAGVQPQLYQPISGRIMTNVLSDTNPEDAVSCFTLCKNDSYITSASGGEISVFNLLTLKTKKTFMPPPPAATFLAHYPHDNNTIAIGMEDSTILIYDVRVDEVKIVLEGHQKRITGLAFSNTLNVLVSSGADGQLCVWSLDGWEKLTSKYLQMMGGNPSSDTRVQFYQDQTHLLVVHSTHIAIYEAPKLECLKQWVPQERGPIIHATYSCDSRSIYVILEDGSVSVLTAPSLTVRCRINPSAYLPSNPSVRVYPSVIAAHPSEPNKFALGLTDGGVCVLEPLESDGQWGTALPENASGTTMGYPMNRPPVVFAMGLERLEDANLPNQDLPKVTPEAKAEAAEAKARGDDAFRRKNIQAAVDAYTQAIDLDKSDGVLYLNRSLCWLRVGQAEKALEDAKMCRALRPDWYKACYPEGAALLFLQRFEEAANAFYDGLKHQPEIWDHVDAFSREG